MRNAGNPVAVKALRGVALMRLATVFVSPAVVLIALGCGGNGLVQPPSSDEPSEATEPCEVNNTATATFENNSATNRTFDVLWDGSRIGTVKPGRQSPPYTITAGVQHSLQFVFTNTFNEACSQLVAAVPSCTEWVFECAT
jgi:hypothetical protein